MSERRYKSFIPYGYIYILKLIRADCRAGIMLSRLPKVSGYKTGIYLIACWLWSADLAWADSVPDKYPESMLYSKPVKVSDNIWSAIGATQYYSYENGGHNNNLSFIVGDKGVLVVNGGSAYLLAKSLRDEIRNITDKPVLYVVDENGQSHAALGNGYWQQQGVQIIAHEDAATEIEHNGLNGLEELSSILREQVEGTAVVMVDQSFTDQLELDLGGLMVRLMKFGPAHSPGDILSMFGVRWPNYWKMMAP